MDREALLRTNRRAYDALAEAKVPLCRPAKDGDLADPLATVDPAGWLGSSIAGQKVLCLAAGGGRQSSLYAAAGAEVTVVDLSGAMLELDRRVAAERGFAVRLIQTSMDDLSMLAAAEFDLVIQPVSTCYLPDVQQIFLAVARVTRPAGLYVSQHKTPTSLQASTLPNQQGQFTLEHAYYRTDPIPAAPSNPVAERLRERGSVEFLHRWEELIGGICRAGFVIEDLVEPVHADPKAPRDSFTGRGIYLAPYVRIKARRRGGEQAIGGGEQPTASPLWIPSQ